MVGIWELGLQGAPHSLTDRVALWASVISADSADPAEPLPSFWGLEFWHTLVTCLAPSESFVLHEPPRVRTCPLDVVAVCAGGTECTSCDSAGRGPCELVRGFLRALSRASLPVADFALKPSAVMNDGSGYHCLMNSLSH